MTTRVRRDIRISRTLEYARPRGHRGLLATAFMLACLAAPVHAQSRLSARVALASQLVDRGLAVSGETPILQGEISTTSPTGWSFGLAGGMEAGSARPVLAVARVSRSWTLSGDWMAQAGLLYSDYRSQRGSTIPDRVDANVYFTYRDILTFGLSASHARGQRGQRLLGAADVDARWPLARHVSLSAGAGIAQAVVRTRGPVRYGYRSYRYDRVQAYGYGNLGLAWSDGDWRVQVDRTGSSLGARRAYGTGAPSPWVATLSLSF